MRRNRTRHVPLLLAVALSVSLLVTVPGAEASPAQLVVHTHEDGHRHAENLGLGPIRTLEVSEASNRLVLADAGTIKIFTLDTWELVAEHSGYGFLPEVRIHESTAFFLSQTTGVLTELDLVSGELRREWHFDDTLMSIALSEHHVWVMTQDDRAFAQVSRIVRASGELDQFELVHDRGLFHPSRIRVSPGRPNEFFIEVSASPTNIYRYEFSGLTATRVEQTVHGLLGSGSRAFELSKDGAQIWWGKMVEIETETLELSSTRYDGEGATRGLAVEAETNAYLVLASYPSYKEGGKLALFEPGTPVAINEISTFTDIVGTAVTNSEVLAVTKVNQTYELHAWSLDFQIPDEQAAEPAEPFQGDPGHRGLNSLGFDKVSSLGVSQDHDRIAIAGDHHVELYSLSNFALIARIDGIYGAVDLRIQGSSAFVAGSRDGVISEIDLDDGSVLHQWATNAAVLKSIDASDQYVWFFSGPSTWDGQVGRIERSTGLVETIEVQSSLYYGSLIRVTPGRPDDIYIGRRSVSPGSIIRYTIEGAVAVPQHATSHGGIGSNLRSFEPADAGGTVWVAAAVPYALLELRGQSLRTSRSYAAGSYPVDVALEPDENELVVMSTSTQTKGALWLFDARVLAPRNHVEVPGMPSEVAVTSNEFFAIVEDQGGWGLHAWTLDFQPVVETSEEPPVVEPDIEPPFEEPAVPLADYEITIYVDGHGSSDTLEFGIVNISCGDWTWEFNGFYGQSFAISVPGESTQCVLSHSLDSGSVLLGTNADDSQAWTIVRNQQLAFDPSVMSALLVVDVYPGPTSSEDHFVEQTYRDTLGISATQEERRYGVEGINRGTWTRAGFVLHLMDSPDGYESTVAPVARLYRAFFIRDPEVEGLAYWMQVRRNGLPLREVAEYFSVSPEFDSMYGSLSDEEFIALVYRNVMGREADADGYRYWLGQMHGGMTRGELMVYFSDSPEYRGVTGGHLFSLFVVRALERHEPTKDQLDSLRRTYESSGREAVVAAVLDGQVYFDRFWLSNGETGAVFQVSADSGWDDVRWSDVRDVIVASVRS